ncbi:MAG: hypothetical protein ACRD19_13510 [Terriglobia bacterium]
MTKGRYLLIGVLLCALALISAGCETMNPEWSGNMPNESGPHVQPQNLDAPRENNNDAIRPLMLMRDLRTQSSGAASTATGPNGPMKSMSRRGAITLRGLAGTLAGPLATGNAIGDAILPFKNVSPVDGVALPTISASPARP